MFTTSPIALLDFTSYSLRLDTFALHYYNLMSHLLYINIYCMVLVCSCRLRHKFEVVDGMQASRPKFEMFESSLIYISLAPLPPLDLSV